MIIHRLPTEEAEAMEVARLADSNYEINKNNTMKNNNYKFVCIRNYELANAQFQSEYDALKVAQTDLNGTARFMS